MLSTANSFQISTTFLPSLTHSAAPPSQEHIPSNQLTCISVL
jgi:hypothetical protein